MGRALRARDVRYAHIIWCHFQILPISDFQKLASLVLIRFLGVKYVCTFCCAKIRFLKVSSMAVQTWLAVRTSVCRVVLLLCIGDSCSAHASALHTTQGMYTTQRRAHFLSPCIQYGTCTEYRASESNCHIHNTRKIPMHYTHCHSLTSTRKSRCHFQKSILKAKFCRQKCGIRAIFPKHAGA